MCKMDDKKLLKIGNEGSCLINGLGTQVPILSQLTDLTCFKGLIIEASIDDQVMVFEF